MSDYHCTANVRDKNGAMITVPIGRNVEQLRAIGTKVVRLRIPAQVRRELMAAVKDGLLGHLKKDGLKPEIFFHPDQRNSAMERQKKEEEHERNCAESATKAVMVQRDPVEEYLRRQEGR